MSTPPTTIPPAASPAASPQLAAAIDDLNAAGRGPLATLYGYAAPWKDPATLLAALERVRHPVRVLLAGPLWDDPGHAGIALPGTDKAATLGNTCLRVLATYLTAPERAVLASASDLAVFSYQPHAAFQGSGAIADYLAAGVPVVATDVANMAELIGHTTDNPASTPAGDLVPAGDPGALATALDRYSDPRHRSTRTAAAPQARPPVHPRHPRPRLPRPLPPRPRTAHVTTPEPGRPTELVLARHGEAHCNRDQIVGGPRGCRGLTDRGHRQARLLAPGGCVATPHPPANSAAVFTHCTPAPCLVPATPPATSPSPSPCPQSSPTTSANNTPATPTGAVGPTSSAPST